MTRLNIAAILFWKVESCLGPEPRRMPAHNGYYVIQPCLANNFVSRKV